MTTYTITLSAAEDKALAFVAVSQQEWIDNVVHDRCRIEMEQIIANEVKRKLDAGEPITGSKDDIVLAADIKSAAQRDAELRAEFEAQEAAKQAAA